MAQHGLYEKANVVTDRYARMAWKLDGTTNSTCCGKSNRLKCDQPERCRVQADLTTSNLLGGSTVACSNSSTKFPLQQVFRPESIENCPPLPTSVSFSIRHCVGHVGYAVTSDGVVMSCLRTGTPKKWKILKRSRDRNGYFRVCLGNNQSKPRVRKNASVLVLEAFVGPRPDGMVVCHKDDNPANDSLENLRWDTQRSNWRDSMVNGTCHYISGERHPNAKISDQDAAAIRNLYATGQWTQKKLGMKYGIGQTQVSNIVKGLQRCHSAYYQAERERRVASRCRALGLDVAAEYLESKEGE